MWFSALCIPFPRVLCALGLALGFWWHLPSQPAVAQTPPGRGDGSQDVYQGAYDNLEVHLQGRYHLQRWGPTVRATFSSARSPLPSVAGSDSPVLFTLPPGYRPAIAVTWTVAAQPVDREGQLLPAVQARVWLSLQILPDGTVRYRAETAETFPDRGAHLAFATTVAWPWLGAEPQVCLRTEAVQEAILQTLWVLGEKAISCEDVTWPQLARLEILKKWEAREGSPPASGPGREPVSVGHSHDLAGLLHLRTAYLQFTGPAWTDGILFPVPGLTRLDLAVPKLEFLPAGFLASVPRLETLHLGAPGVEWLPTDFLAHTPGLTELHLDAPLLTSLPDPVWRLLQQQRPPSVAVVAVPAGGRLEEGPVPGPALLRYMVPGAWPYDIKPGELLRVAERIRDGEGRTWLRLESLGRPYGHDLMPWEEEEKWVEQSLTLPAGLPNVVHGPVVEGQFLLGGGNTEGRYQLRRTGNTVTALVTLPGSRLRPRGKAWLFRVPANLRPTQVISWMVKGWTVPSYSLESDSVQSSSVRMRIERGGEVYLLWDGVAGEGSYGSVTVALAWPIAGTVPQVCLRSIPVQERILEALAALGERLECDAVTWEQLARIRTLEERPYGRYQDPLTVSQSHDLAGLVGLETLRLSLEGGQGLSALLAQTPRLRELEVDIVHHSRLPTAWLQPVPLLRKLTVRSFDLKSLPADFLSYTSRLEALVLRPISWSTSLWTFSPALLVPVPHLKTLELLGNSFPRLPAAFLAPVPELEHLVVDSYHLSELPKDFLKDVPNLKSLELVTAQELLLPADFLVGVPRLTQLQLVTRGRSPLPYAFLAPVPHLTHLQLWVGQQEPLPVDFLLTVPHLSTLELLTGWTEAHHMAADLRPIQAETERPPSEFFSSVPYLTSLALWINSSKVFLPTSFLPPESRFTHQILDVSQLNGDRREVQTLTHLTLQADGLSALPPDLLAPVPGLTHLTLQADGLSALPPDLLAPVPGLTHLTLQADGLSALPPDLLAPVLGLTHLTLQADGLSALPPDLLAPVPGLTHLTLHTPWVESVPGPIYTSLVDHGFPYVVVKVSRAPLLHTPDPAFGQVIADLTQGEVLRVLGQAQFMDQEHNETWLRVKRLFYASHDTGEEGWLSAPLTALWIGYPAATAFSNPLWLK